MKEHLRKIPLLRRLYGGLWFIKWRLLYVRSPQKFWESGGGDNYFNHDEKFDLSKSGERLVALIKELRPESILDVGCGYGRLLKLFKEKTKAKRIVGIDFSKSQLDKAREYVGGGVELKIIDAERLPFPDKCFDVAVTAGVLMHNPPRKAKKVRKELIRISRYIIHDEVLKKKFYMWGYDNAEIYKKMGYRVLKNIKYRAGDVLRINKNEAGLQDFLEETRQIVVIDTGQREE